MGAKLDLNLKQGETFRRLFSFKNADESPKDVSSQIFRSDARTCANSPDVAFSFVFDTSDAVNGNVYFELPASVSSALSLSSNVSFIYDAEREDLSGNVVSFISPSKIKFTREITR